jgi:hypothetical protein
MADPTWLNDYRVNNGLPVIPEDPEAVQAMINNAELQVGQELQMYLTYRLMVAVTP